jgi:D-alanyl-lipoteichoic acid acyltransferase DltB (MBOAT superfamily)
MTIAGVWHGAGWTFVLFGFLHGIGLTINHLWRRTGRKIPTLISWFLTINFVNICLVFFSASSLEQSYVIISRMFFDIRTGPTSLFQNYMAADIIKIGMILVIATCVTFFSPNAQEILDRFRLTKSRITYTSVLIVISLLFMNTIVPKEFIYFAF